MDQGVSLITLGVADVEASKAFYERLGWKVALDVEETVFFQAGDLVMTLWGRDKLAADSGVQVVPPSVLLAIPPLPAA